jgi:hypothetical protein
MNTVFTATSEKSVFSWPMNTVFTATSQKKCLQLADEYSFCLSISNKVFSASL